MLHRFFYINCTYMKGLPMFLLIKAEKFSAYLLCGGSLIHIFGPKILKLFLPNFNLLALTTFKFRFRWLQTGLSDDLTWKMFDIKHGFNWYRELKNFKIECSQSLNCHCYFAWIFWKIIVATSIVILKELKCSFL